MFWKVSAVGGMTFGSSVSLLVIPSSVLAYFLCPYLTNKHCKFWIFIGLHLRSISCDYKEIHQLPSRLVDLHSTVHFNDDTLNYSVTRHGLRWSLRVRLSQSSHTNHGNTCGQRGLIGECTRALRLCLASSLFNSDGCRNGAPNSTLGPWALGTVKRKIELTAPASIFFSLHFITSIHFTLA